MTDPPPPKRRFNAIQQMSMAMELPFIFVGEVVLCGVVGFFLDRFLHTKPWLTLLFGFAGFGIGIRDLIRRLDAGNSKGGSGGG
jgi:F0F1-type ATP synthase assembly protein I